MATETKPDPVTDRDGKEHDLAKAKVPKWLRDYIEDLRQERDEAMGNAEEELAEVTWRQNIAGLWRDIAVGRMASGQDAGALRALRAPDPLV